MPYFEIGINLDLRHLVPCNFAKQICILKAMNFQGLGQKVIG